MSLGINTDNHIKLKFTGMTLNFDSDVLRPTDMIVIDSILMIVEPSKDKLIHLFNLSTHRILFHLKGVEVLGQPFHPAKLYSFFP